MLSQSYTSNDSYENVSIVTAKVFLVTNCVVDTGARTQYYIHFNFVTCSCTRRSVSCPTIIEVDKL